MDSQFFKPSEALIPFVDVWIRLLELSIEYYDKEVFQNIAKAIGVYLVKIDPVTERLEKCMFARICIRITLCNGNPLILSIQFGEIQHKIEYEGLDSLCHDCGCFYDLKHDCLNQNNPFGSSGFDPHQHRPHPSSGSKKPLIHSLPQNQDWDPNPMKKTHFLSWNWRTVQGFKWVNVSLMFLWKLKSLKMKRKLCPTFQKNLQQQPWKLLSQSTPIWFSSYLELLLLLYISSGLQKPVAPQSLQSITMNHNHHMLWRLALSSIRLWWKQSTIEKERDDQHTIWRS